MLIIGNNERRIVYIIEYTVKLYIVSVFKWGFRDHLLVLVEDSHKITSVCCLLGNDMFSFIHDLLHRVHYIVVHRMWLDTFNFICTAGSHYDFTHACSSKVTRHWSANLCSVIFHWCVLNHIASFLLWNVPFGRGKKLGRLGLNGRYEVLVSVGSVYLLSESINTGRTA